jgi:hypothetical protein
MLDRFTSVWEAVYDGRTIGVTMARNNYKSEKRRKELDRQKKNEEKRLRRLAARDGVQPEEDADEQTDEQAAEQTDAGEPTESEDSQS